MVIGEGEEKVWVGRSFGYYMGRVFCRLVWFRLGLFCYYLCIERMLDRLVKFVRIK